MMFLMKAELQFSQPGFPLAERPRDPVPTSEVGALVGLVEHLDKALFPYCSRQGCRALCLWSSFLFGTHKV